MTMTDMASAAAGHDGAVASGKGPRAGQPKRRAFTAAYKARILRDYDQLESGRERGALLRREGLYSSHIGTGANQARPARRMAWRISRAGGRDAAPRRWKTSGCGGRTRNSPRNWHGLRQRLKWWEKRTRSWSCSPGARTQTRSGTGDRRGRHRARTADFSEESMRIAREITGYAAPPAPSRPGRGQSTARAAGAAPCGADGGRAGRAAGDAGQRAVR